MELKYDRLEVSYASKFSKNLLRTCLITSALLGLFWIFIRIYLSTQIFIFLQFFHWSLIPTVLFAALILYNSIFGFFVLKRNDDDISTQIKQSWIKLKIPNLIEFGIEFFVLIYLTQLNYYLSRDVEAFFLKIVILPIFWILTFQLIILVGRWKAYRKLQNHQYDETSKKIISYPFIFGSLLFSLHIVIIMDIACEKGLDLLIFCGLLLPSLIFLSALVLIWVVYLGLKRDWERKRKIMKNSFILLMVITTIIHWIIYMMNQYDFFLVYEIINFILGIFTFLPIYWLFPTQKPNQTI